MPFLTTIPTLHSNDHFNLRPGRKAACELLPQVSCLDASPVVGTAFLRQPGTLQNLPPEMPGNQPAIGASTLKQCLSEADSDPLRR